MKSLSSEPRADLALRSIDTRFYMFFMIINGFIFIETYKKQYYIFSATLTLSVEGRKNIGKPRKRNFNKKKKDVQNRVGKDLRNEIIIVY